MPWIAGSLRVLLARANRQAGSGTGRDDLPDAPPPRLQFFLEVILATVHGAVHRIGRRMVVEEQEVTAFLKRGRYTVGPRVEVVEPLHVPAGVDEVEATAAQLARERLRSALDPEDSRPALARDREHRG